MAGTPARPRPSLRAGQRIDKREAGPAIVSDEYVRASERWTVVAAVGLVLLLATRQTAQVPGTLGSTWSNLVLYATGAVWLITRPYDRAAVRAADPAFLLALFFVGTSLLSMGWGWRIGLPHGADPAGPDLATLRGLVLLLYLGFLLRNLVSVRAIKILVSTVVVGTAVSAFYALVVLATGLDLAAILTPPLTRTVAAPLADDLMREGMLRPAGAAGHPLELAFVLSVAFPLSLARCLIPSSFRWPWVLCSGLIGMGLLVSLSRSALVAVVLAVLVMACFWPARRATRLVGVLLAGGAAAFALRPSLFSTILTVFATSSTDDSVHSRGRAINYAIDMIARSPWLGCGDGCLTGDYHPYLDNQYLGRLLEGGILGLSSFVILLVGTAIAAVLAANNLRRPASNAERTARELAVGLVGAMVPILVITAVLDTTGFAQAWTLMWTIIGACWAILRVSSAAGDA